jgi:hypothetical protein
MPVIQDAFHSLSKEGRVTTEGQANIELVQPSTLPRIEIPIPLLEKGTKDAEIPEHRQAFHQVRRWPHGN